MINQQPPEKPIPFTGTLEVNSIFLTIQGEGPFAGWAAVFIRLAGCNLQCPGCDTEYTKREHLTLNEIRDRVYREANGCAAPLLVVITGGEPFRQNLSPLVGMLLFNGFEVQIETNGTLYQKLEFDRIAIVCSPKTGAINPKLLPHINAFKYVLDADSIDHDGLPIVVLGHPNSGTVAKPKEDAIVYIQPADAGSAQHAWKSKLNTEAAIASAQKNGYILCIQIHKLIGVP